MLNVMNKASEALGEPKIARIYAACVTISDLLNELKGSIEEVNGKGFLVSALEDVKNAQYSISNISIKSSILLETGYRLLPPEFKNH